MNIELEAVLAEFKEIVGAQAQEIAILKATIKALQTQKEEDKVE